MPLRRKILIILCLVVYNLSFLLNYLLYFQIGDVVAEEAIQNTNIVTVFVDKKLQQDIRSELEWYTKNYIQSKLTNTKALVFPIDKNNFKAHDIYKILENLYLQGDKEKTTTLVGAILVGDLPLPVVKNGGYVFPSIYPYVDFVDKKYVYDTSSKYFELNNEDGNGPEIWHGVVNLGIDQNDYKKFFTRLKTYNDNPTSYVTNKIWYDDFVNMKNSYSSQNLYYYLSNFVFLEDLAYHRYNTLMLSMFNENYTKGLTSELSKFSETLDDLATESKVSYENADSQFDSFKQISQQYYSKAQEFRSNYMTDEFTQDLSQSYEKTPTLLVYKSIEPFLKKYNELFGNEYYSSLKDNILAAGRWGIENIDTHATKTFIKDELSKKILVEYNKVLESALDSQVDTNGYYMKIPVLHNYEAYKVEPCSTTTTNQDGSTQKSSTGIKYLDGRYENFYFGLYAGKITQALDFSIYRGTYKNLSSNEDVESMNYSSVDIDDISFDATKKSVGSSYGIMKRQTEANRGYNFMIAEKDGTTYESSRCSNSETVEQWANRYRGSASPLNYDYNNKNLQLKLKSFDYKDAWNPTTNASVGGTLFDIAGSKLIEKQDSIAYGFQGYDKYASVIQTRHGVLARSNFSSIGGEGSSCPTASVVENVYCGTPKSSIPYSQVDFINTFPSASPYAKLTLNGAKTKEIYHTCSLKFNSLGGDSAGNSSEPEYVISGTSTKICNTPGECNSFSSSSGGAGIGGSFPCPDTMYEKLNYYNYGLVDTRLYHKNPTSSQIAGMNSLTLERPIDDPRYISFKGIGGDEVNLIYPNLLNIEVFNKSGDRLELKSYDEIKQSVRDYLKNKVIKYNEILSAQQQKSSNYYGSAKESFDFLASVDSFATPGRSYQLLDENYFINILGEGNIDRIASSLYYVNNMWSERTYSENVVSDMSMISTQADLNKKIKYNTQTYLRSDSSSDPYLNPGYQASGYEVGVVNSDGIDTIFSGNQIDVPDVISKIDNSRLNNGGYYSYDVKNIASLRSNSDDSECGVGTDGGVILWQWPSSFSCWLSQTLSKSASVRFNYSCSRSDVLRENNDENDGYGPDVSYKSVYGTGNFYADQSNLFYSGYLRDSFSEFVNKYSSINSSQKLDLDTSWNNYITNWDKFMGKDYTINTQAYSLYSSSQQQEYDNLKSSIQTSISDTPSVSLEFVDESGYNKYLNISSSRDLGALDITIALIGENCFQINGVDLCKRNVTMTLNPYINPQLIPLNFTTKSSGTSILQLKICKSGSTICYNKNQNISVNPGNLQSLELYTPTDRVLRGGMIPFALRGYDKFGNPIGQTFVSYDVSVNNGLLSLGEETSKTFSISDLKQAYFLYDASALDSSVNSDIIDVKLDEAYSGSIENDMPRISKQISIVDGVLSVNRGSNQISNLEYNLPESFNEIYFSPLDGITDLDLSKTISLNINLKDTNGNALSSPARIYSERGLLVPGVIIKTASKYIAGGVEKYYAKNEFSAKDDYIIKSGKLDFYLHPSFGAGEDTLIIQVPGLADTRIPFKVYPSSPKSVDIVFEKNDYNIGEKALGKVYLKDVWGNVVTNVSKNISVGVIGNSFVDGDKLKTFATQNGEISFELITKDPGGKVYVYTMIEGTDLEKYAGDYEILNVKNINWPKEKMNVMYLNLFGSDWGNLWGYFSENKGVAKQVINNSDKILSLTTQLMSPSNIKRLSTIISQDLRIFNIDGDDISIGFESGNIIYKIGEYPNVFGRLNVGSLSEYNISLSDKFPETLSQNSIVYIPQLLDSRVTSNLLKDKKISINNQDIIDFNNGNVANGVEITLSPDDLNGYNLWEISYNGIIVGNLVLYRSDDKIITGYPSDLTLLSQYQSTIIFGEGSTNGRLGLGIYKEGVSSLDSVTKAFNSIEDASDPTQNIGFRADFRNINDFANGLTVGSATKSYQSEFEINFGDPVLTRISNNAQVSGVDYDLGIGQRVYSLPGKNIVRSLDIDFNNDGFKDILIAYSDGSVRLLKNYGGNTPFIDTSELMVVSDGISDLFAGDVDKNGFQDIVIKTTDNKLRVYQNKNGLFDIDGKIICLDVPSGPDKLEGVYQVFVEDMNLDGAADIVTSDIDGSIKIFYGGSNDSGDYYLSSLNYKCDDNWSSRQKNNVKLVKNYGIQIMSGEKIYDDSLVHWKGLIESSNSTGSAVTLSGNTELSPASLTGILEQVYPQRAKYQAMPIDFMPSYENIVSDSIAYNKIIYLTGSDPISVSKYYEDINGGKLQAGDLVKINVVITGHADTKITYLEHLSGPWEIYRDDETDEIDGFDTGTLPKESLINWKENSSYQFMIDNIDIKNNQTVSFSYTVGYYGLQVMKIEVDNFNSDNYPDIKVYPNDGCIKCTFTFEAINEAKDYNEVMNDFSGAFKANVTTLQGNTQDFYNDIKTQVDKVITGGNMQDLTALNVVESWDDSNIFKLKDVSNNYVANPNAPANINTQVPASSSAGFIETTTSGMESYQDIGGGMDVNASLFNGNYEALTSQINNILHGLCKGFKFGKESCGGLDVPFNMSFFAPGYNNFMGCPTGYDDGKPFFRFPSTKWQSCKGNPCCIPLPIPNQARLSGIDNPNTKCCAPCPGVYPANIRLYLSPTLTMGLGFAACFGPYKPATKLPPAPFGTVAGNCVVTATNFSSGKCTQVDQDKTEYMITDRQQESIRMGSCNNMYYGTNRRYTPFAMYSSDGENSEFLKNLNLPNFANSAFGMNGNPRRVSSKMINFDKVFMKGGDPFQLKIEGGSVKGLIQCIMKKWIDKQIRYIINNLTNMTVYVYLPDVETLGEGFDKLKMENLTKIRDQFENDFSDLKANWNQGGKGGGNTEADKFTKEWLPSKSAFKKASDTFSNPFNQIENLLEEVPLFKIRTKNIRIQVPVIYQEDILKYSKYLQDWTRRQEQILQQWGDFGRDLIGECDKIEDTVRRESCKKSAETYMDFNLNARKLINSVKQNILILGQYMQFPFKLYDWIHSSEKYLKELICIIEKFFKSTIGWIKQMASRFEKWVDFIILLLGIIETWQILIDFSVKWRSSCAKCRQDDYDQYTCALSLLCVDLPVLPIPPFRLPDIYLDLSHIDLGIDIVLPKFTFAPMALSLPRIPDLPKPPKLGLGMSFDFTLPAIPLLPELPELPVLPSFLPTIDFDLPLLPPAPKIPALIPEIRIILEIAKFIGRLYCIIKSGIGLVAEWNVKARIEQLTQRTNRVFPFDFMQLIFVDPPLAGNDVRIDAYLKMRFDFDMLYQFAKSIGMSINESTGKIVEGFSETNRGISNTLDGYKDKMQGTVDSGKGMIDQLQDELKEKVEEKIEGKSKDLLNFNNSLYFTGGMEYQQAYNKLKSELTFMQNLEKDSNRKWQISQTLSLLDMEKQVAPNVQGLEKLQSDVTRYIESKMGEYSSLAEKIKNDYNGFLEEISKNTLISDNQENVEFKANLFNSNPKLKQILKDQEHPYKTYLDINSGLLDGYRKTMSDKSPTDLNMSDSTYNKTKMYLDSVAYEVNNAKSVFEDKKSMHTQVLLAENVNNDSIADSASSQPVITNPTYDQIYLDPTQFIDGFFIKSGSGDYYNVMNWQDKGSEIYKAQDYKITDMNKDGKDDILWWDSNSVYVKYAAQNSMYSGNTNVNYRDYYEVVGFDSPSQIKDVVDSNGYYKLGTLEIKIWDSSTGVENFRRSGQSYETMSFSWTNDLSKNNFGYVVQLIQRTDVFQDKRKQMDYYSTQTLDTKYVLVVPENFDEASNRISIQDELDDGFIYDHVKSGLIYNVVKTKIDSDSVSVALSKIPRKWYYARVAALNYDKSKNLLSKDGPWSNKSVAGSQLRSDRQVPMLSLSLVREKTGQIEGEGNSLIGYINTNYKLDAKWKDNGYITDSWVEYSGSLLNEAIGTDISIKGLYFTGAQVKEYTFVARDHAGNLNTQKVQLNIKVPEININSIETGELGGKLGATLSHDVDDGTVKFERFRDGIWSTLTGVSNNMATSLFNLGYNQNYATGGIFDLSDKIILYDSSKNEVGYVKVDMAQIVINDGYKDKYELKVDFKQNTGLLKVLDKSSNKEIFVIYIKPKNLISNNPINILNGDYRLVKINSNMMGEFVGGYCVQKSGGDCIIYVSPKAGIYVPSPMNSELWGEYIFDESNSSVIYKIYDLKSSALFDIRFIPESFRK